MTTTGSLPPVEVRPAAAADAARVAEIYNQGIAGRAATFETAPRTPADMERRITDDPSRHPVLVAVAGGTVVGWAGISAYRSRACYDGVGEFSVYIDAGHRGHGVGRALLDELIATAARLGYWKLLSRVFPFNAASLALCRSCGFREVGTYERHACLDGQWLDVVIVERLIPENQPSVRPSGGRSVSQSEGRPQGADGARREVTRGPDEHGTSRSQDGG